MDRDAGLAPPPSIARGADRRTGWQTTAARTLPSRAIVDGGGFVERAAPRTRDRTDRGRDRLRDALPSWSARAIGIFVGLLVGAAAEDRAEERGDHDRRGDRHDERAAVREVQHEVLADQGAEGGGVHGSIPQLAAGEREEDVFQSARHEEMRLTARPCAASEASSDGAARRDRRHRRAGACRPATALGDAGLAGRGRRGRHAVDLDLERVSTGGSRCRSRPGCRSRRPGRGRR